jgi:hypothetical protein
MYHSLSYVIIVRVANVLKSGSMFKDAIMGVTGVVINIGIIFSSQLYVVYYTIAMSYTTCSYVSSLTFHSMAIV